MIIIYIWLVYIVDCFTVSIPKAIKIQHLANPLNFSILLALAVLIGIFFFVCQLTKQTYHSLQIAKQRRINQKLFLKYFLPTSTL